MTRRLASVRSNQKLLRPYDRLVATLERYLSAIILRSVLAKALAELGVTPDQLAPKQLDDVVNALTVGLRLFCENQRLVDLRIELGELCDRELAMAARDEASSKTSSMTGERERQATSTRRRANDPQFDEFFGDLRETGVRRVR